MKTFEQTTASNFLVIRQKGFDVELNIVRRSRVGYVASQIYYMASLGVFPKPRKVFVAEYTDELKAIVNDNHLEISHIEEYAGATEYMMHNYSRVKKLVEAAKENQVDIETVFKSTTRRDFFIAVFSPGNGEDHSVAKFLTNRDAKSWATGQMKLDAGEYIIFDSRSQKPAFKEIFAYIHPKEVIDVPAATSKKFMEMVTEGIV